MRLHFGTQSLNGWLSIEKPRKKEKGKAYCTGETNHLLFKTLMVKTSEITKTDSRIQTSCPKFYHELLYEYD